jgi:prepilin-type N-terminal cleavage/methylation domain-containing protein
VKRGNDHPRVSPRIEPLGVTLIEPSVARNEVRGVTLMELLVVIVLMGLLAGVVGLTMNSTPGTAALDPSTARVMAARDSALRSGHPVTIRIAMEGSARYATAFPDGRVLTDAPLRIDALSGSASRAESDAASTTNARMHGHATP